VSLRRTKAGLESLHIFYRVDLIAFCEGGQMLSVDLIANGSGDDGTVDALFWSTILEPYRNSGRKLHVKSVGNKPTLLQIYKDIRDRQIDNIIICLDSDYDRIIKSLEAGENIKYTYGYSWENDAFHPNVMRDVFFDLLGQREKTIALWEKFMTEYISTSRLMADISDMEIELIKRDLGTILDRDNPSSCFSFANNRATISKNYIRNKIQSKGFSRRPRISVRIWPRDEMICTCGKVVAKYCFHLFNYYLKQGAADAGVSFPMLCRLLVGRLGIRLRSQTDNMELYLVSLSA
jgi:hypothetical protein